MRDKKKSKSEKTPEQEALEKHVDAMMDPKLPDTPASAKEKEPQISAVAAPAIEGPTTAPQLSAKLRGEITASKPLEIDKLDELAEEITKSASPKKTKKSAEKPKDEPDEAKEEEEKEPDQDPTEQSTELDDARIDEAVDDIVAYESDVVLAVADSTAEARNREAAESVPKGHPVLSTVFWTFIAIVVILIIALGALLLMGDNLANKLGL